MTATPEWLLEDLLAETGRAGRVAERIARTTGEQLRDARRDPWLDGLVDAIASRMRAGTLQWCEHLARPSVIFAAAWRPDRLACPACWRSVLDVRDDPVEDHTCDRCRAFAPGGIHQNIVQAGPVMLAVGLCGACQRRSRELTGGPR